MKVKIFFLLVAFMFFSSLFYCYLSGKIETIYRNLYLKSLNIKTSSSSKSLNKKILVPFKSKMIAFNDYYGMKLIGTCITENIDYNNYAIIEYLNEQNLYRIGDEIPFKTENNQWFWTIKYKYTIQNIKKNKIWFGAIKEYTAQFCHVNKRLIRDFIDFSLKGLLVAYNKNGIEGLLINSEPSFRHDYLRKTGLKKGDVITNLEYFKLKIPKDMIDILITLERTALLNMDVLIEGTPTKIEFKNSYHLYKDCPKEN